MPDDHDTDTDTDGPGAQASIEPTSTELAHALAQRLDGRTISCAESFTAGLLGQTLASVPSSSEWFDGSLVAYRTVQKRRLLGVDAASALTEECAVQMAAGASGLFGSQVAVSTTGVAGPAPQEGIEAGTVMIGWAVGTTCGSRTLHLDGDPEGIVVLGVRAALETLLGTDAL